MSILYLERSTWFAGIAFFAALVVNFWPRRWCSILAAVLYAVGILTHFAFLAQRWWVTVWIGFGLSGDSGSPNRHVLWFLIIPIGLTIYAVSSSILLWPTISQRTALFLGKILHLCFLPPIVLFLLSIRQVPFGPHPFELQWFVYPLLWFRIREGYAGWRPNTALEPTPTAP
jgi:hypothetical protein